MIEFDLAAHGLNGGSSKTPPPKHDTVPDQSLDSFRQACGVTGPFRLKLEHPAATKEFAPPFILVGRESAVDLRLDDSAVSRRHAYLQWIDGHLFCLDLGSRAGLLWDGQSRRSDWLLPGQALGIGPFTLRLPDGPANPAPEWNPLASRRSRSDSLPTVELEILNGSRAGRRGRINRVLVLAGQAADCRARLTARGIAHYHCSLLRTSLGTWVVDLLTAEGTFVNETRVRWAKLNDSDELRIGDVRFGVRARSATAAAVPDLRALAEHQTTAEIEQLRVRLSELEQAATAARTEWDAERQTLIDAAKQQRHEHEQAVADATQREAAQAKREQALRTEIEQLQAWVSELEVARAEALTAAQAGGETAQARIRELEQDRANVHAAECESEARWNTERTNLQIREEQAQIRIRELEQSLAERDNALAAEQESKARWNAERTKLQEEVARLEREANRLREQAEALSRAAGSEPITLERLPETVRPQVVGPVLGEELRFDNLGITVASARVRSYTSTTAAGRKMTHEPALVVELTLKNHAPDQVLRPQGQVRSARLEDMAGNAYRSRRATNELGLENAIDGQIRSGSGRPVQADADERDVLVFDPPSPDANDLVLTLDAAKYGGNGPVKVLIPKAAWYK